MIRRTALVFVCAAACGGAQSTPSSPQGADPVAPERAEVPPVADGTAPAELGQMAPAFTLPGVDGEQISLADYKGKTVILEWFNPGCPFVVYAHGNGPLKDASAIPGAGDDNIVWLAINSGAPGKQGHGLEMNKKSRADWGMTYPLLIDDTGAVGKVYGARTTPHMYVIDPEGTLVYRGALDNQPLGKSQGDAPRNYVAEALADLAAGQPVATPETKSYGCGVKY